MPKQPVKRIRIRKGGKTPAEKALAARKRWADKGVAARARNKQADKKAEALAAKTVGNASLKQVRRVARDPVAIVKFANDHTRRHLKMSLREYNHAVTQVYAVFQAFKALPRNDRKLAMTDLQADAKRVTAETRGSRDPLGVILRVMLAYPGEDLKLLRTRLDRDKAAILFADSAGYSDDEFERELGKRGNGLEKWARAHRASHRLERDATDKPTTASARQQKRSLATLVEPSASTVAPGEIDWSRVKAALQGDGTHLTIFDVSGSQRRAVFSRSLASTILTPQQIEDVVTAVKRRFGL